MPCEVGEDERERAPGVFENRKKYPCFWFRELSRRENLIISCY